MIDHKECRLGVCPIGKFAFSHEDAKVQKNAVMDKLRELGVDYADIEEAVPDGLVRSKDQAAAVVAYLKEKQVDALFMPHCNFGTEDATGIIARELDVPVLLWAPRDGAPLADGSRLRDSLCGSFAASKVLHTMGVKFDYIENCRVEDGAFRRGMELFLGAVRVVKAVKTARIGQIGIRIPFFWCTVIDEARLLNQLGVQVYPFDMVEFIERYRTRLKKDGKKYEEELREIRKWLDPGNIAEQGMLTSLAMKDELFEMAEQNGIDAYAIQNFDSLTVDMGEGSGLGGALAEERIPVAAETDIHGALSSIIIEAAANGREPSFFPEFTIRHPQNDNAVLMWHASAPPSLRDPRKGKVSIREPWILKSLPATSLQFPLKNGELTVCRFDGNNGEYRIGTGEGKAIDGPQTREVYTWYEVDDWPKWERRLIEGPYVHHVSCLYGNYSDILEKACRFLPGVVCERFDR